MSLVWLSEAQCQTKESCLSILGSSEQNPMLVGPESVAIKNLKSSVCIHANVYRFSKEKWNVTENVVGLGPFLLKSFSGYPNSGGTTILLGH